MKERGTVIVESASPPTPRGRWAGPGAIGVGALLIIAFMTLGNFDGGARITEDPPDIGPDPIETALLTVEEFSIAWNKGDADAVSRQIPDDWESIVLPGFTDTYFEPADGRSTLNDGISFLTSVADLSLGACTADFADPDGRATTSVWCEQGRFDGHYLQAIQQNIWGDARPVPSPVQTGREPGIGFELHNDQIVTIDVGRSLFSPQAYCIWAEQAPSTSEDPLFDLNCLPRTEARYAEAHAEAATAYMEAGAPLPSWGLAEARLAASYIDRFVELHNVGDTATVDSWLASSVRAADLPGFAGGDEMPPIADYLLWSARVMDIDTGPCSVELKPDFTIVTCPHLTVDGLLVDGALAQPTRFTLAASRGGSPIARSFGRILYVQPLHNTPLRVDVACRDLQAISPTSAADAFTDDCEPIYTSEAATTLTTVLSQT